MGKVVVDCWFLALPPEIIEAPKDTQAVDGQDVTMICKVLGAPKPSVKWSLNDRELTGGRYHVQNNGDLLITNVQFDDRGNYTCFAENKFGTAAEKAQLFVKCKRNGALKLTIKNFFQFILILPTVPKTTKWQLIHPQLLGVTQLVMIL